MRTTLEIKDEFVMVLQERATAEHRSFKDVCNEVLGLGLGRARGEGGWTCPSHAMGGRPVDYTKAWELADELEATAVAEKMDLLK